MMVTKDICIMLAIIAYLCLVVGIGIYYAKKTASVTDFYLGGRKLGPFVTAMSAEASDMSSWLLMGLPGVAYVSGIADAAWTAIGLAIGTYINWLIVAKRLRKYTDEKNILSGIAAVIIIIFFIPYTGSGFAACGKLFNSLFGIDYHVAMIISAIVIVAYTTLGGFLAASTSDFMQSIIMTIALIVILGYGVTTAGGIDAVMTNANSLAGYFTLTHTYSADGPGNYVLLTIISTLAWGLGYFGMPHIILRFMAIEDSKKLKLSRRIATIWVVISLGVAIFIGVIGNAMSANGVLKKLVTEDGDASETIIVEIAKLVSNHGVLAALIAGVILAGILAATMSTADSQLLAASSSASKDLLMGTFKMKFSDKTGMLIARGTVVMISIVAVIIAWNPDSSVFKIVSFAWAGFGAAFGPIVLFSLFWKRTNMYGALAGLVSGGAMVFVWKFIIRPMGGALDIYELLPAFIVSSVCIVIVSLLTKKPDASVYEEFEKVKLACKE